MNGNKTYCLLQKSSILNQNSSKFFNLYTLNLTKSFMKVPVNAFVEIDFAFNITFYI